MEIDVNDPATQMAAAQLLLEAAARGDWETVDKLSEAFAPSHVRGGEDA